MMEIASVADIAAAEQRLRDNVARNSEHPGLALCATRSHVILLQLHGDRIDRVTLTTKQATLLARGLRAAVYAIEANEE